jgi:hypothetical protein
MTGPIEWEDMRPHKVPAHDWSKLKAGDMVIRMLAGTIPVPVKVEKVEHGVIYMHGGWTFLVSTGAEVDGELGWDGITRTGSYLLKEIEH